MAETGAVFGGEHSGHFYFRDFWRADSGMLAALHVLAALGGPGRAAVRRCSAQFSRYAELRRDQQRGRRRRPPRPRPFGPSSPAATARRSTSSTG